MILLSLLDALQGPLWVSVQATGKIRDYQILMSVMILANLPVSYLFLRIGYVPEVVLEIRCILSILILWVRLWYLKRLYAFSSKSSILKEFFLYIFKNTVFASASLLG